MRYLLDTNACIALMRNHPKVLGKISTLVPGNCAISTITSYELYTGIEKCAQPARERPKVDHLLATIPQLPFDFASAKEAARIRAVLEAQGLPIGPYDFLLAGQALAMSLIVVTANTGEFSRVPGLTVEDWQT